MDETQYNQKYCHGYTCACLVHATNHWWMNLRRTSAQGDCCRARAYRPTASWRQRKGLALVTASRVYAELEAMGLVSGEMGRGTFVRETSWSPGQNIDQHSVAAGMTDLNFNYPALPGQTEMLRNALRQLASAGDLESLLRYQPHAGRPHERASVARHLRVRGLTVEAEQVLIVTGAQQGLAVTMMALLQPGDVIAADALTYSGFKALADSLHLEIVPIPVLDHGPDLEALESLCRHRRVRAVYTMPTLHNPLGWVMSADQRECLVTIARQHGLLIIEDAAYAFLAEKSPAPLAVLAPERTIYVSGLSKSVATGLRVGFVVAPPSTRARAGAHDQSDHLEYPGRDDGNRHCMARRRHRHATGS